MVHIAHLRNAFKSINTFAQSHDYIIRLSWREKSIFPILITEWSLFVIPWVPFTKDALGQVSLKLAGWFWRRWFLNFANVFSLYCNYYPLEKGVVRSFIWENLNDLYPRMPCAKFRWNWPSGSSEEYFLKSLVPIDRKFHGHGKNDGFVLYECIIKRCSSFCKYTNISVIQKKIKENNMSTLNRK